MRSHLREVPMPLGPIVERINHTNNPPKTRGNFASIGASSSADAIVCADLEVTLFDFRQCVFDLSTFDAGLPKTSLQQRD
ncbi:hypothetical protein GNZ12_27790 [Paraburkholderia sp. 1N]|uniref:Uncharacterized protein n=1 Tax=Paraburkholderia solitsugae TaxID=2675748 RepID=A0ABX2BYR1_9BURK|nr:hypothetical protein [Paraburkholderia solitsugae]NPT45055.1 hypothetical protein [Paraburkholderia solitsugae]